MAPLHPTWLYIYSTIALLHSTWLYIKLVYHGSTWLYLTLHYSTNALLHSTWLHITLHWLYFTLLDCTLLYIDSTSLYFIVHYCTMALLHSTWLLTLPHWKLLVANSFWYEAPSHTITQNLCLSYVLLSLHSVELNVSYYIVIWIYTHIHMCTNVYQKYHDVFY